MLGALITGVRRAFPYVAPEEIEPLVESSGEQLFRIVHKAPFTVGVQVGVWAGRECRGGGGGELLFRIVHKAPFTVGVQVSV